MPPAARHPSRRHVHQQSGHRADHRRPQGLLRQRQATGADAIASGANRIANLGLTFTQQGNRTIFDLKSNYDNAPLTANGNVETGGGQTVVNL